MPGAQVFDLTRHTTRLLALFVILGLGWGLRTHDLDARSLWADEGWTMLLSEGPALDEVTRTLAADQHPPAFFMAFRLWRNVAGESEIAGRYFSVLAAMLAIAAAYQMGRTLYGVPAGVLAALMLTLSDLHIDLAQEVRHYSWLATLIILSSLFYARWWRNPTRTNRLGYVLSSILLLYTHYLGGYVLVAQFVHMLLTVRPMKRLANALFLFGAVCAAFLPWALVVLEQNRVRWDNPLYYQNALPNTAETYRMIRTALLGQHYALLGLLALLGLVILSYAQRNNGDRSCIRWRPLWPTVYLVLWILVMVGVTVAINARRDFLTVRNFIVIVPALALLVARGLSNLPATTRGFVVMLIVVISLTTVDARRSYPDWRAVTQNVTQYHLVDEPVLMDVWVGDFPVRYYIDRQMGSATPRVSLREWRDTYRAQFLPTLLGYIQQQDAFWLVDWGTDSLEYASLIEEAGFQRTAALSVDHQGTPIFSYRYDRLSGDPVARFGNLFALQKVAAPTHAAPGDTLRIMMWWVAEQAPPLDYSVSVFVLDESGTLVAQHDGSPLDGAAPTSTWQPGATQFDAHRVTLPDDLLPGSYQLGVRVYWYGDNAALSATGPRQDIPADYILLGTLAIGQ